MSISAAAASVIAASALYIALPVCWGWGVFPLLLLATHGMMLPVSPSHWLWKVAFFVDSPQLTYMTGVLTVLGISIPGLQGGVCPTPMSPLTM